MRSQHETDYDYYWYCRRIDMMTSRRYTEQFLFACFDNAHEFVRVEQSKRPVAKQEYEWQWLYFNVVSEKYETTEEFYKDGAVPNVVKPETLSRIEESKRPVEVITCKTKS